MTDSNEYLSEIIQGVGLCGSINADGTRVCILPVHFGTDHGWEPDAVDATRVFAQLTPREAYVLLARRMGAGTTLEAVGIAMGVTRERVRQIEAKALRKLRVASVGVVGASTPPTAATGQ